MKTHSLAMMTLESIHAKLDAIPAGDTAAMEGAILASLRDMGRAIGRALYNAAGGVSTDASRSLLKNVAVAQKNRLAVAFSSPDSICDIPLSLPDGMAHGYSQVVADIVSITKDYNLAEYIQALQAILTSTANGFKSTTPDFAGIGRNLVEHSDKYQRYSGFFESVEAFQKENFMGRRNEMRSSIEEFPTRRDFKTVFDQVLGFEKFFDASVRISSALKAISPLCSDIHNQAGAHRDDDRIAPIVKLVQMNLEQAVRVMNAAGLIIHDMHSIDANLARYVRPMLDL